MPQERHVTTRVSPLSFSSDGSREILNSVASGNMPAKERRRSLRALLMEIARATNPPHQHNASAIDGVTVSISTWLLVNITQPKPSAAATAASVNAPAHAT